MGTKKELPSEFEELKHYTTTFDGTEYIRFGKSHWYSYDDELLTAVGDSTKLDKMYREYVHNKWINETKTVEMEWNEATNHVNVEAREILSSVLASMDKKPDIEQAVIFAVDKRIKLKYGFTEPLMYNYRIYDNKAADAIKRIGNNINPFRSKPFIND